MCEHRDFFDAVCALVQTDSEHALEYCLDCARDYCDELSPLIQVYDVNGRIFEIVAMKRPREI